MRSKLTNIQILEGVRDKTSKIRRTSRYTSQGFSGHSNDMIRKEKIPRYRQREISVAPDHL
jgi:hypothetical protein